MKSRSLPPLGRSRVIHTIGYQNLKVTDFIDVLRSRGVTLVVDIRNNPFSFKPGFSKKWLMSHLPEYNIGYVNIPELGIPSKYRKELNGTALWKKYDELLRTNAVQLHSVVNMVQGETAVLMCFEAHPRDCHRSRLAQRIGDLTGLPVTHYHSITNAWSECEKEYSLP